MRHIARPAALAALIALTALPGCVGAPAPGPVGYAPGYGQPPGYAPSGYVQQPGYAPPPGYGQGGPQLAIASTCYAGVYTCALPQGLPVGAQCSCPGLGAPSYGTAR